VAQQVLGIDAILVGHAHLEIPERRVVNETTGREVVLTEPLRRGMRLSLIDLTRVKQGHRRVVESVGSSVLNSNTVAEDPHVTELLTADHGKVISYVNTVIGTCTTAMSCGTARYEDTAALGFINLVQGQAVCSAPAGTAAAALPMLSIAAPFYKDANIPAGQERARRRGPLHQRQHTARDHLRRGTGQCVPREVARVLQTGHGHGAFHPG
jgi:2',3'-cyclic-nucleotide 2'-phosphodiesterase/3'-nucleotidase